MQQQKTITPPWLTQKQTEKAEWFALNTLANQLAFIIQRNSALARQAKAIGIQEINKRASYYHHSSLRSVTLEKSTGLEY